MEPPVSLSRSSGYSSLPTRGTAVRFGRAAVPLVGSEL